ncbi:ABC transporter ATP-binding protein [Flaviaesturariibacter aridisoli]|uniref:ABC transporter ATP-binding protein n=1 Tax=Flaviaesturariibacter aridisoli TaxID=2545761 RepID=A0A4R4EAH5_9BACT|nr:ATP-binding cassette domain-containing protein [Flaviaesturariibacter aridisoli]TCZ74835.1 ABC transporter ATP-binding protein [Flaviaesturariibacter aridisoli]
MQRAATRIELAGAGRRFNHDWIFRKADLHFHAGHAYALTGPNGSGKSTLLQLIGGLLQPSEGKVHYYESDRLLAPENIFRSLSLAAPYLDVIEEMTALEFLRFHARFKPFRSGQTPESILERVGLAAAAHKQVRYYSSGMKQRVKLAQAFFSDTSVLLLDEPTSNLDIVGVQLYLDLINEETKGRLVIVCSNDPVEYAFCGKVLSVLDYKPAPRK